MSQVCISCFSSNMSPVLVCSTWKAKINYCRAYSSASETALTLWASALNCAIQMPTTNSWSKILKFHFELQAEPLPINITFFSNYLPLLKVQKTQTTIYLKTIILEDFEFELAKYAQYNEYLGMQMVLWAIKSPCTTKGEKIQSPELSSLFTRAF